YFDGAVVAGASVGAERRQQDGSWTQVLFWGIPARELVVRGEYLYAAIQNRLIRLSADGGRRVYDPGYPLVNAVAVDEGGQVWMGSRVSGLLRLPPLGPETGGEVTVQPEQVVVPGGPFNSAIRAIA